MRKVWLIRIATPRLSCAGSIAEDPLNCEVISREEGAVQQLIPMALSDNEIVVEQACKTLGQPNLEGCNEF